MDAKTIKEKLEDYKKAGANLLFPSERIEILSEFHSPVLEVVNIDPNPDNGDVYPTSYKEEDRQKGPYRITKQGLMKLSNCANIAWDSNKTGVTERDKDYILFQAVGGIKGPDGMLSSPTVAHYPVDFKVLEEDILERTKAKAGKNKNLKTEAQKIDWIKNTVSRDIRFERTHALKKAESGAKSRIIRDLLGIKGQYTKAELQKPFIVLKYEFKPDYSDPVTKKIMLLGFLQGTGLFGGGQMKIAAPDIEGEIIDVNPTNVKPAPPEKIPNPNDPPFPPNDSPTQPDGYEGMEVDFENSSPEEQIATLKTLIAQKRYAVTFKAPLERFQTHQRLNFFKTLIRTPDAAKAA